MLTVDAQSELVHDVHPKPIAAKPIMMKDDDVTKYSSIIPECILSAESGRATFLSNVKSNRSLLDPNQTRTNKPFTSAYDGHIPSLKSDRDALVARISRALVSVKPILLVDSADPDTNTSDDVERFVQYLLTRSINFRRTFERILQASFDDGVALAYVTWKTEQRQMFDWQVEPVEGTNKTKATATPVLRTTYDGPNVEYIPIENAWCYPAASANLQESQGVYIRYTATGDDVLLSLLNGDYDKDAVDKLREVASDISKLQTSTDEMRKIQGNLSAENNFHDKIYQLTDCYWKIGTDDQNPAQWWLITIHEASKTILRAIPNPWWHGKVPLIVFCPFLDKEGIAGDSLADKSGQFQKARTTLLRAAMDAMTVGINPEMVVPASGGANLVNEIRKHRGPNAVLAVPDQYVDKIKPFFSGYHPNTIIPMTQDLRMDSERASGVSDTMRGIPNSRDLTATEIQQMMESGQELITMMMDRESDGLTEFGQMLLDLIKQFAGSDYLQALWQMVNPKAEMALWEAMNLQYDIHAAGTSETQNRAYKAQRAALLLSTLTPTPFVATDYERQYKLLKYFLHENGFTDVEDFIGTEAQAMEAQQARLGAQTQNAQLQGGAVNENGIPAGIPGLPEGAEAGGPNTGNSQIPGAGGPPIMAGNA